MILCVLTFKKQKEIKIYHQQKSIFKKKVHSQKTKNFLRF